MGEDFLGCFLIAVLIAALFVLGGVVGEGIGSVNALSDTYRNEAGQECIRLEMFKPNEGSIKTYGSFFDNDGEEARYYCEVEDER